MVGGGDGSHGHSEPHRGDFGAVQEVGAEETDGDEEVEHEDEESSSTHCGAVLTREAGADREGHHAACHAETGEDEERAATETIDGEEGDETGQELPGQARSGENTGELGAHAQTVLEQDGGVDTDEVAIRKLANIPEFSKG